MYRRIEVLDEPTSTISSSALTRHSRKARSAPTFRGYSSTPRIRDDSSEESDDNQSTSDSEDEESDNEISEYKRVRLLDDGVIRWDPISCSPGIHISKNGLGVSYMKPQGQEAPKEWASVIATKPLLRAQPSPFLDIDIYFEIKVLSGKSFLLGLTNKPGCLVYTVQWHTGYTYISSYKRSAFSSHPSLGPHPRDNQLTLRRGDIFGCGIFGKMAYAVKNKTIHSMSTLPVLI